VPKRSPRGEAEVAIFERRRTLLQMRREGHSFEACAETLGYYDASHASRDYHAALTAIPAPDVEAIRLQEADNKKYLYQQQMKVVLNPPKQHSAIGKPIEDPLNPGTYLINESVRNTAIRNANTISDSYCKLMGVPLVTRAPDESAAFAEAMEYMTSLGAERDALRSEVTRLRGELARHEAGEIVMAEVTA